MADHVAVKTAVFRVAVNAQIGVGGLQIILRGAFGAKIEAGAVSSFLIPGVGTIHQNVAPAAAIVCIVNTVFYITIQTYHSRSFLFGNIGPDEISDAISMDENKKNIRWQSQKANTETQPLSQRKTDLRCFRIVRARSAERSVVS